MYIAGNGDRVMIRRDLVVGVIYDGMNVVPEMMQYGGMIAKITDTWGDNDCHHIDLDHGDWIWTNGMFERPITINKEDLCKFLGGD